MNGFLKKSGLFRCIFGENRKNYSAGVCVTSGASLVMGVSVASGIAVSAGISVAVGAEVGVWVGVGAESIMEQAAIVSASAAQSSSASIILINLCPPYSPNSPQQAAPCTAYVSKAPIIHEKRPFPCVL